LVHGGDLGAEGSRVTATGLSGQIMGTGSAHREGSMVRSLMLIASGAALALAFQQVFLPQAGAPVHEFDRSSECEAQGRRLALLESSMQQLQQEARSAQRARCPLVTQASASTARALASSAPAAADNGAHASARPKQPWSWTGLVLSSLRPFERNNGGITLHGLRLAEQKCKISTWCHRAQVIDGRLYITDLRSIFFDRHYAMARVMPLLLTMQRFKVPDLDAVFSGTDYPIMDIPRDAAHMERMYGPGQPVPPVFSPTANTASLDLPWPDFSFFPPEGRCGKECIHPLKTPRWQRAHPELLKLGRKLSFDEKIDRAVFTGNMKTSPNRQTIFAQAQRFPELLFVNEVYIKTSPPSCFAIGEPNVTRGGTLVKRCGLSFEELCRYKYLLNVGSNGYANKLKYLFLTGSVVIWVKRDSLNYEFFEHQFVPGVHYVSVETVDEVPDMIRRLQADPEYARGIAMAGQARMAMMDVDEVAHYCYSMLKAYAAVQRFKPKRDPRSWEVNCEDDLVRHYDRGTMLQSRYLTEDNSTCLRSPPTGTRFEAPGWGGAYSGTHPPCLASHDLSAKEEVGVCTEGTPQYKASGRYDGPDWDVPEAYKGGMLPDWSDVDPAVRGKGARTIPYNSKPTCSSK
jgi:protein glucosyltransferase